MHNLKVTDLRSLPSLFALLLLISVDVHADADEVNLLTSESPPYQSIRFKNKGAFSELITEAFRLAGIKANISVVPWNKAYEQAKSGKYDGVFPAWYTDERSKAFYFSAPFVPNLIGFYAIDKHRIHFSGYSSLKPYRIGIVKDYAYPQAFFDAGLKTIEVGKDEQNLALLCRGLIDLALTDKVVGRFLVDTRYSECSSKIYWLEPSVQARANHLAISKKVKDHRILIASFNRGLRLLQQQGGIRQILARHGMLKALEATLLP